MHFSYDKLLLVYIIEHLREMDQHLMDMDDQPTIALKKLSQGILKASKNI